MVSTKKTILCFTASGEHLEMHSAQHGCGDDVYHPSVTLWLIFMKRLLEFDFITSVNETTIKSNSTQAFHALKHLKTQTQHPYIIHHGAY